MATLPFATGLTTFQPGRRMRTTPKAEPGCLGYLARNGDLALSSTACTRRLAGSGAQIVSEMGVLVYADSIDNPVIEAMGHFAARSSGAAPMALLDRASGLLRCHPDRTFHERRNAGHGERRLPGGNESASATPTAMRWRCRFCRPARRSLAEVLAAAHPRHAQMYSLSLSGTLDGTGTRWRASYRWQPEDTVTQVAPLPRVRRALSQPPPASAHPLSRDGQGWL
jgi:hypothetical protein